MPNTPQRALLDAAKAALALIEEMAGAWPGTMSIDASKVRAKLQAAIGTAEGERPEPPHCGRS